MIEGAKEGANGGSRPSISPRTRRGKTNFQLEIYLNPHHAFPHLTPLVLFRLVSIDYADVFNCLVCAVTKLPHIANSHISPSKKS